MKISYITTDLEFDSASDLTDLMTELGDKVSINLNEWVGQVYRVAVGVGYGAHLHTQPDEAIVFYCSLIENLSDSARASWDACTRRVLYIGFESGTEPHCVIYQIPEELVRRSSDVGLGIAITIYQVGAYHSDTSG